MKLIYNEDSRIIILSVSILQHNMDSANLKNYQKNGKLWRNNTKNCEFWRPHERLRVKLRKFRFWYFLSLFRQYFD